MCADGDRVSLGDFRQPWMGLDPELRRSGVDLRALWWRLSALFSFTVTFVLSSTLSKMTAHCVRSIARTHPASQLPIRPLSTTCIVQNTSSSGSSSAGLTGADKLLQDALQHEAEEQQVLERNARKPDPTDPVWTGEERVQDTVLRMVMDKYKPLRLPLDSNANPADEKIKAGIQTPTTPGSLEAYGLFQSDGGGEEGGRKLPKTPDAKPWRAVYVRPPHLLGSGATEEGVNVRYGQFLKSSSSSTLAKSGESSELRAKLKAAGLNPNVLPTDDPKAMSQLRANLKTAERRGKLVRARDRVLDYQLSKPVDSSDEVRGDEVSDTNRNLQLQLGHAQGWDSVVEKRIKAAQDAGLFRSNKLRGKPLQRDMEEKNPFLAREEYFMNRIVKRQGAAPPWVELNMELEAELASWRGRMDDTWVRRASRMITTSSTLCSGLTPLPAGEGGLQDVATRYRDREWEERERAYHTLEVKRLNELVRRHNHLAPFTARKGLLMVELELEAMYKRVVPRLVAEVSRVLEEKLTGGEGGRKEGWDDELGRKGPSAVVSYDMWGREVRTPAGDKAGEGGKGYLDGWWGSSVGSAGEEKGGEKGEMRTGEGDGGKQEQVMQLGVLAAIQKSLQWARQRIGV